MAIARIDRVVCVRVLVRTSVKLKKRPTPPMALTPWSMTFSSLLMHGSAGQSFTTVVVLLGASVVL